MSAPALRDDQYWHPYVGGAVLGVVLFTAFLLTGSGLSPVLDDQVCWSATSCA